MLSLNQPFKAEGASQTSALLYISLYFIVNSFLKHCLMEIYPDRETCREQTFSGTPCRFHSEQRPKITAVIRRSEQHNLTTVQLDRSATSARIWV